MVSPAKKLSLHEDILKQMLQAIKEEEFTSGEKLPREIDLAEQFQVSRNCVREAMKTLGWLGIVESVSGQGTFVTKNAQHKIFNTELLTHLTDNSSFLDLMETRIFLEPSIAFFAALNATDEDVERLRGILERESGGLEFPREADLKAAREFHDTLAEVAGNKIMMKILDSIRSEIDVQRSSYADLSERKWQDMLDCHKEILKYVEARNPEKAFKAMYEDLLKSIVVLQKDISTEK